MSETHFDPYPSNPGWIRCFIKQPQLEYRELRYVE